MPGQEPPVTKGASYCFLLGLAAFSALIILGGIVQRDWLRVAGWAVVGAACAWGIRRRHRQAGNL
ncbi:MAG TPA: hypothetical protein VGV63_06260 [Acidimicrobiales bacterium]|nr:hypothetical protein [Acidimicrobiales bacterium]